MSSIRLDPLIDEFPAERESLEKLSSFIDRKQHSTAGRTELTVERIFDVTHPSSEGVLLAILQRLVQQGVLDKVLRVQSDFLGDIGGDFHHLKEIPPVLFDSRRGIDVEVRLDQVRLVYVVKPIEKSE
jgi:hypothetical protein